LGFLHNYVHSKGRKYSNSIGLTKSNFQTFENKGFIDWFDAFDEVVKVLSILHLTQVSHSKIRTTGRQPSAFQNLVDFWS